MNICPMPKLKSVLFIKTRLEIPCCLLVSTCASQHATEFKQSPSRKNIEAVKKDKEFKDIFDQAMEAMQGNGVG